MTSDLRPYDRDLEGTFSSIAGNKVPLQKLSPGGRQFKMIRAYKVL